MKKAKKTKAAVKKAAKKKGTGKGQKLKKDLNPKQTWKEVALLVESNATKLAGAVINEGIKGGVTPVKFLFEMANIHPPESDEDQKKIEEEECLAKTLLDRLGIPSKPPEENPEEDEEDTVVIPAKAAQESEPDKSEETVVV
jgi:hypothetical protein